MNKLKNKYILYMTLGIICVIGAILSVTYALFRTTTVQNSSNLISTLNCINLSITGNNSALTLNNAYPLSDEAGMDQTPYTFTVKNNCSTYVEYQLILSVVNTSTINNKEYIKIDLSGNENNHIKTLNQLYEEPQQALPGNLNNYTLINNSFDGNISHTYNFRMWLNGDNEDIWTDDSISNQNIKVKLSIIGVTKTNQHIESLRESILAQGNGKETIEAKPVPNFSRIAVSQATYDSLPTSATKPAASKNSAEVSNGLFATVDEYGMSYYYRGEKDLLNNNLIWGGFQWKIVRINGDGSFRVVYNGTESDFNKNGTVNTSGTSTRATTSAWNSPNYDDAKYVGYMFGGANGVASTVRNGTTSAAATYNETPSRIKTNLEDWYKNNILGKNFEEQVVDNIFCNDRQLLNEIGYSHNSGLGYGNGNTYYVGMYDANKKPTTKCKQKNDQFTKTQSELGNGKLIYPIGLITGDEANMAGLASNVKHINSYLYTGSHYWTFTPAAVGLGEIGEGIYGFVSAVYEDGELNNVNINYPNGVRPVLNLSPDLMVIGNGSSTNPFKVQNNMTLKEKILLQEGGALAIQTKNTPDFSKVSVQQSAYNNLPETAVLPETSKSTAIVDSGIYSAEDEYGTSYYYRGDRFSLNNNVLFGGFQWKIVRINGDGSIRLVYNGTESQFKANNNTMNSTTELATIGSNSWDFLTSDSKYVGFMHGGAKGAPSIERNGTASSAATFNETSSEAKKGLDNWYLNNIAGKPVENSIVDNVFCNDRQLRSEVGGAATGTGYGNSTNSYAISHRLNTNKTPSLKCNQKNDRFTVEDTVGNSDLTYPVGLLSADEAAMAGLVFNIKNATNYLYTGYAYWTMSPGSTTSGTSFGIYGVNGPGQIFNGSGTSATMRLRPVINLSPYVKATGSGSMTNPFVVSR